MEISQWVQWGITMVAMCWWCKLMCTQCCKCLKNIMFVVHLTKSHKIGCNYFLILSGLVCSDGNE